MATKRPKGNDATQDLSLSDLIVPGRPPAPPNPAQRGSNPKNDMSLWGGVVVGTSDFAPAPVAPKRDPRKWIIGGTIGGIVLVAVLVFVTRSSDDGKKSEPAAAAPEAKKVEDVAKAEATGVDTKGSDAKVDSTADAKGSAVTAASGSGSAAGSAAGVAAGSGAATPALVVNGIEIDAISGVAPVIRAKKAPVRKAPVKKTAAVKKAPVKKAPVKKTVPKKK